MTVRVTGLTNTGYDLAMEMSSDAGISYARLLKFLTPAGVYDLIMAIYQLIDNLDEIENHPSLYQEGEEGTYEGQPIVWDGGFELRNGELWYSGYAGAGGCGGFVTRKIMPHDIIEWQRCEPMSSYTKG